MAAAVREIRQGMLIFALSICFVAAPVSALSFMVAKGSVPDWASFSSWLGSWHDSIEDDVTGMALGVAGVALSLWIAVALSAPNYAQTAVRARAQAVALDAIVLIATAAAAVLEVLFIPVALGKTGPLGAAIPLTLAGLLCGLAPVAGIRADIRSLEARRLGKRLERVNEDLAAGPAPLSFRKRRYKHVVLVRFANPKWIKMILGLAAALIIAGAILYDGTALSWWKIVLLAVIGGGASTVWSAIALELACSLRARWLARGASGCIELLVWPLGVAMWATLFGASIEQVGGQSAVAILTPLICAALPIVYSTFCARSTVQRKARAAWLNLEAKRLKESIAFQDEKLNGERPPTAFSGGKR